MKRAWNNPQKNQGWSIAVDRGLGLWVGESQGNGNAMTALVQERSITLSKQLIPTPPAGQRLGFRARVIFSMGEELVETKGCLAERMKTIWKWGPVSV